MAELENKLKDIHITCYFLPQNQKVATLNLWINAVNIFKEARCIKNIERVKQIHHELNTKGPHLTEGHAELAFEAIMDNTRIITCFENFMKGVLLLNDYVVHKISSNHKKLRSVQAFRPVKIHEVFTSDSFLPTNIVNKNSWDVYNTSVNFSWMLTEEYQKVINLGPELVKALNKTNDLRNNLHFMKSNEFEVSNHNIATLERYIKFVDDVIVRFTLDLDNNLGILQNQLASFDSSN